MLSYCAITIQVQKLFGLLVLSCLVLLYWPELLLVVHIMATVEAKRKKSVSIIEPPNILGLESVPPTKKESVASSSSRRSSNASITESTNSSRRSSLVPTKTRSRSGSRSDLYDYISGTYEFERFDDNLEEYLDSLGLSGSDLGTIVRQNKIRVEIKRPESSDEKWSLTTTEYSKNSI